MHRVLAVLLFVTAPLAAVTASAHDSWISRGGLRNAAGEWCCGAGDCFTESAVHETRSGYQLSSGEVIPFSEAQPSPDGAFWRCKRPDGSRRCFFAPPSGY